MVSKIYAIVPFSNSADSYNGADPPNDSWMNCNGEVQTYVEGRDYVSENKKKIQYWTTRAIKEKNPKLCNNVGFLEGTDYIEDDMHEAAVRVCNSTYERNLNDNYYLNLNLCPGIY